MIKDLINEWDEMCSLTDQRETVARWLQEMEDMDFVVYDNGEPISDMDDDQLPF